MSRVCELRDGTAVAGGRPCGVPGDHRLGSNFFGTATVHSHGESEAIAEEEIVRYVGASTMPARKLVKDSVGFLPEVKPQDVRLNPDDGAPRCRCRQPRTVRLDTA